MSIESITIDSIAVPDAPAIPGLRFRHFRGESDYPHIARLINASAQADHIDRLSTVDDVAATYRHLVNCDPRHDAVFADVGDETVAYTRVEWRQVENGPRVYTSIGYVDPAWRRRGLGTALLSWSEQRRRAIAATHDAGEKLLELWAADTETALEALAVKRGFKPVRYAFDMIRLDIENLPDYRLPDGIEIRPVTPEQYPAIWDADVEAFRDHWGFAEPTEEIYKSWLEFPHFEPGLWTIAWDGDQIAGQVRSFINREENTQFGRQRGYTEFISVRRPWRRRGIARALIVESLKILKAHGMTEAALGVDAENLSGALRVYQDCGFVVEKRFTTFRKPIDG